MSSNSSLLVRKIFFTLSLLLVFRVGSFIPIPGIDAVVLSEFAQQNKSGVLGMFNMLSGGALERMSVFALAVMPYITASIVVQLLTIAYKPLEDLKKEGESGKTKMNQISRYLTILFAAMQAYGVAVGLEATITPYGSVVVVAPWLFKVVTVITLVVGTIFLMWLGEQISLYGIGNGTSLIIFVGIVSGLPVAISGIFEMMRKNVISPLVVLILFLSVLLMIAFIVCFERAQRKILIEYPKRQVGNKVYSSQSTHMPLKINTAGVIPPIFASSILLFPLTISQFSGKSYPALAAIANHLGHGKPLFLLLYVLLIVFFSFFYTSIVFNSEETANNLKKHGSYVVGYRPGENTAKYLDYVLTRLTVLGSAYLSFICIVPELLMSRMAFSFALGGTSFLIVVNVVLDTFTHIQTHLFSSRYESLIKKIKIK